MKRFTETTKWRDGWYRRLSPEAKLLWQYFCDNCSQIGLVEVDLEAASFDINASVTEDHLAELESRFQPVQGGKIFITKFIDFQYGNLSPACPAHKPIFKLIELHQIKRGEIGYQYPTDRVSGTLQEKEKEKEKEGEAVAELKLEVEVQPIPQNLLTPEFTAVWNMWLEHLTQKRKKPTKLAKELQLKKLSGMGLTRAIAAVNNSIQQNYQGIYESNGDANGKNNQRPDRSIGTLNEGTASQYRGIKSRG